MNAYPHREYPVIKHYLKKYVRKQYWTFSGLIGRLRLILKN
jgi:hypothetical protein